MTNTLEEASAKATEMFGNNEQLSLDDTAPPETQDEDNQSVDDAGDTPNPPAESTAEQQMLNEAVDTAEVAAEAASSANQELEMLRQQNAQILEQNQNLQSVIEELSKQNQQNIIEEALKPPTLDIEALSFADEETRNAAMAKFAEDMSAYNRQELMKELSPALEFAKAGIKEKEKNEVISALSELPELEGIKERMPQLDRIIAGNKWLQSDDMPIMEKYISAYMISEGINKRNAPPPPPPSKPTTDELMKLYSENPEFRELIEKQRLSEIKQGQQVPPFSASSGAVNAALDIKEKPKTLEEASQLVKKMFGGN